MLFRILLYCIVLYCIVLCCSYIMLYHVVLYNDNIIQYNRVLPGPLVGTEVVHPVGDAAVLKADRHRGGEPRDREPKGANRRG